MASETQPKIITSVEPKPEKIVPELSKEVQREVYGVQTFLEPEKRGDYQVAVITRFRPMSAEEKHEKERCEISYIINDNVI